MLLKTALTLLVLLPPSLHHVSLPCSKGLASLTVLSKTSDHPSSSTDISPLAKPSDDFTELPSPENLTSMPTEDDIPPCPSPMAPADASSRSSSPDLDPDAMPSD
ncbi:hypothetical protein P7K49_013150 [Saguinus oedipus]|uniref:Secreted protein n=1 Tax=Saguinus oedipus TaxID=9490 RepID=A0ABQ9VFX8_SAGOE|nr:hypothetical protein P7K49_013150 [Saguinus oedipus]